MKTDKKVNFVFATILFAMIMSSCSVEYRERHRPPPPPVEEKVIVRP
jgi:hypothetical protein